jgi:hypothetical protein
VLAATDHVSAGDTDVDETDWLLTEAGLYLRQRAEHQEAQTLFERVLAIREAPGRRPPRDRPKPQQPRQRPGRSGRPRPRPRPARARLGQLRGPPGRRPPRHRPEPQQPRHRPAHPA